MAHGPGIIHTKKPIEKLEELKGVKGTRHRNVREGEAALGGSTGGHADARDLRCAE